MHPFRHCHAITHSVALRAPEQLPTNARLLPPAAGDVTHVEKARCTSLWRFGLIAEPVVVKTFRPGVVRDSDVLRLAGEVAKLSLVRHR